MFPPLRTCFEHIFNLKTDKYSYIHLSIRHIEEEQRFECRTGTTNNYSNQSSITQIILW
jgi:hypothetical protein